MSKSLLEIIHKNLHNNKLDNIEIQISSLHLRLVNYSKLRHNLIIKLTL